MKNTIIANAISAGQITKKIARLEPPSKILKHATAGIFKSSKNLYNIYQQVGEQVDILSATTSYNEDIFAHKVVITSNEKNSKRATFFSEYIEDINITAFIASVIKARNYGCVILEIDKWKQIGKYLLPDVINEKPQSWFGFDSDGYLRYFPKNNREGIIIEHQYPNKFIYPRNEATAINPFGVALFDSAYWLAVGLNGNFEFMMHFAEKDGMDKWIAKHRPGATEIEIQAILEKLLTLRGSGVAVIPEGTNIEKMEVAGRTSSTSLYKEIDEMLRRKVDKLFFGTDLTMQVSGKGGYNSSVAGLQEKKKALNSSKRLIEAALKKLFTYIANVNNLPGSDNEKITVSLYKKENVEQAQVTADTAYVNMGMQPTKQFFINRGYSENEFNITKQQEAKQIDFNQKQDTEGLLDVFVNLEKDLKKKAN